MPARARELALEKVHQVASVRDLRQPVDDGEAVDLLVIERLDVAAFDELENRAAELEEIAAPEAREHLRDAIAVDERAVGAAEVLDVAGPRLVDEAGMVTRDGQQIDDDRVVVVAADGDLLLGERDALADLTPVDLDDARRDAEDRRVFGGRVGSRRVFARHSRVGDREEWFWVDFRRK